MTKVHNDRINHESKDAGYSIRVGKHLPDGSVNLAYVHTPEVSPKANLSITDLSGDIKENKIWEHDAIEKFVYPDEKFLLRELNGSGKITSRNIALTDEFSVPSTTQDRPTPLYYKAEAKGYFDGRGAVATPYSGGYISEPIKQHKKYPELSAAEKESLLYLGTKIKVTNADGSPLDKNEKYKIQLAKQEGSGVPSHAYRILLYTNFRGNKEKTYMVHYEKYNADSTISRAHKEVLNAYPFFTEVDKSEIDAIASAPKVDGDWRIELNNKQYAIIETEDSKYSVYAPSQVMVANSLTRPAHQFKYRMTANLKAKFSKRNPGTIKIGIVSYHTTVLGAENLSGVLKKLNEDALKPNYLTFINPHPPMLSATPQDPRYWVIDTTLPEDQLNDYDIIILAGSTSVEQDLGPWGDALRSFLENGGKLWVDNAGTGSNTLKLKNFITNIGFSETNEVLSAKTIASSNYTNRLYVLPQTGVSIGYENTNPRIEYGAGENASLWTSVVPYATGDASIMYRSIFEKGTMIVSNCGIFRSVFHNEEESMKLLFNLLLSFGEERWMQSPWIQDYVYHKDNLFEQEYGHGYVDDRSDIDPTQIVAKKIIAPSFKESMTPYLPESFTQASGTYSIDVNANHQLAIKNNDFEIGTYDANTDSPITSWSATTANAIPGWNVAAAGGDTPTFEHISSVSRRGRKAVQINVLSGGAGSHAYWHALSPALVPGTYKMVAWMKTQDVSGLTTLGAGIGVYNEDSSLITKETSILGTRDWVKVETTFTIDVSKKVDLRLGFVDGNGEGTLMIDKFELLSIGSVEHTPDNTGEKQVYFYATRPKGSSFDISTHGFTHADVTTHDQDVQVTYTVRSFVYTKENGANQHTRKYGSMKRGKATIRKSDGTVNLGLITTLLPELHAGSEWADRNNVYYEVVLGTGNGTDIDSRFVNLEIFNTQSGQIYYNRLGENIISHKDLFYATDASKYVVLQAKTNYYSIRATKRKYALKIEARKDISLAHPATIDNRDAWYLRVQNGSFTKTELGHKEIRELRKRNLRPPAIFETQVSMNPDLEEEGVTPPSLKQVMPSYLDFTTRRFGVHRYSLPEFNRQVFSPGAPYKRVRKEIAEYVNPSTIRVQNAPLYVKTGEVRGEVVTQIGPSATVFQSKNRSWDKSFLPKVYVDENGDGTFVEWTDNYDIDYQNGVLVFENPVAGTIKVDYNYDNLIVNKRKYTHSVIKGEKLETSDKKTFVAKKQNWLLYPSPIVRLVPYGKEKESNIASIDSYIVDYEAGTITFQEEIHDRVLLDYAHSNDMKIKVKDYDAQSGLIYLNSPITFKDELSVDYFYEENYVEYRGYYDEESNIFMHLDLNPLEGHYCTMPIIRDGATVYEKVPTAKLMNKEIYIYLAPAEDSFGNKNDYTIRHCFSKKEWEIVQRSTPSYLLLGIIALREHTVVENATVLDTRMRGGGLKESISESVIQKTQPLAMSHWDIGGWSGKAYQSNGVVIVEIPKEVLRINGGQFDEKEVTDIIRKYIGFGIYFIIEYK